jgi:hypothetical protein
MRVTVSSGGQLDLLRAAERRGAEQAVAAEDREDVAGDEAMRLAVLHHFLHPAEMRMPFIGLDGMGPGETLVRAQQVFDGRVVDDVFLGDVALDPALLPVRGDDQLRGVFDRLRLVEEAVICVAERNDQFLKFLDRHVAARDLPDRHEIAHNVIHAHALSPENS